MPRVDQVLPDLDQRVRDADVFDMARHGVAVAILAGIRLIVTDDDAGHSPQPPHQRTGEPVVAVPQDAEMPRALYAFEHRREAVDRDYDRHHPRPQNRDPAT